MALWLGKRGFLWWCELVLPVVGRGRGQHSTAAGSAYRMQWQCSDTPGNPLSSPVPRLSRIAMQYTDVSSCWTQLGVWGRQWLKPSRPGSRDVRLAPWPLGREDASHEPPTQSPAGAHRAQTPMRGQRKGGAAERARAGRSEVREARARSRGNSRSEHNAAAETATRETRAARHTRRDRVLFVTRAERASCCRGKRRPSVTLP